MAQVTLKHLSAGIPAGVMVLAVLLFIESTLHLECAQSDSGKKKLPVERMFRVT